MDGRTALLAIVVALALGGCATIPEEKCASIDWFALGVEDGRAGFAADRLVKHREACAGVKVLPDERAWLEGRRAGLVDYCRLPAAIDLGLAGRGYAGVCSDPRFGRLYTAARRVFDTRARFTTLEQQIAEKRRDIANKDTSEVRRDFLRREVIDLQRNRARDARSDAERALDALRRELGV
jgi:hypothetical protein